MKENEVGIELNNDNEVNEEMDDEEMSEEEETASNTAKQEKEVHTIYNYSNMNINLLLIKFRQMRDKLLQIIQEHVPPSQGNGDAWYTYS